MTADACVEHMRSAVFSETKLTVSAGIAPNMVRLASQNSRML
jgi:nucleotidyltransferase/DNA polymerase involved in DNA repair